MKKRNPKPEIIWAFWANASYGPEYKTPRKCKLSKEIRTWWDSSGNNEIIKLGLYQCRAYVTFAHVDKKEVEKFIQGFMSCRKAVASMFSD